MSYSVFLKPVPQLQQLLRERSERPRLLLLHVLVFALAGASTDCFLYIEPGHSTLKIPKT